MKEIIDAIESKIKSPLLGYFFLALFAINWRPIFYLLFENTSILERFAYFDSNSSNISLIFWPLIVTVTVAVAYPWIRYLLVLLSTKPTELIKLHEAQAEHKLLLKKRKLEELQAAILSDAERELIERAKRDNELDEIEDQQVRDKLKRELDDLRKERDTIMHGSDKLSTKAKFDELMGMAESFRNRANADKVNAIDQNQLIEHAQLLEKRAHELVISETEQ